MAFEIKELKRERSGAMYVAPERIYVNAADEVCAADDPKAVRMLVAPGRSIPAVEAAKYGLLIGGASAADAVAGDSADDDAGSTDPEPEFPRPATNDDGKPRKGYFELSDGAIVKGRAKAQKAQAVLDEAAGSADAPADEEAASADQNGSAETPTEGEGTGESESKPAARPTPKMDAS